MANFGGHSKSDSFTVHSVARALKLLRLYKITLDWSRTFPSNNGDALKLIETNREGGEFMEKVVAVLAHPDDAELRCYGTLCKYVAEGKECFLIIASSGEHGIAIKDEQTADHHFSTDLRETETLRAFDGLEIPIFFLHQKDGYMQYGRDLIHIIEERLIQIEPNTVITHYPDPYGADHQDHSAIGKSVLNCINRINSVKKVLLCDPLKSTKSHFIPNYFVDITDYFEKKIKAIHCQTSQKGRFYLEEAFHRTKGEFYAANVSYDLAKEHRVFEAYELYWYYE